MNPSAQGWIEKFGSLLRKAPSNLNSELEFYQHFRSMGFIYGINISTLKGIPVPALISEEEKAKINLLSALYHVYLLNKGREAGFNDFLEDLSVFYQLLHIEEFSFFDRLLAGRKTSHQLEYLLHQRISLNDNIISRAFNQMLTNSMLFTDVLNFQRYLHGERNLKRNEQRLEQIIMNLSYHVIDAKNTNSVYNQRLLQLLETSSRYGAAGGNKDYYSYKDLLEVNTNILENHYFFDLACLAALEDHPASAIRKDVLRELGDELQLSPEGIETSMDHAVTFFRKHRDQLGFLKDTNPFRLLYDNSQVMVKKLILRNGRRLKKELSESKELLALISKSATQDLNKEERERLRTQLLDIFKTIPSLAIFALPGGAVLLPLFVKMIPSLLPSAFDDNRVEKSPKNS
ncbi:LETM1-related biofilm-associated protein [Robertkochia flava]|uniref:LETM1-related biofilm-associated protein n=1 Tax=Robertkochia flava TaxID=3447986 RepID=UPI001CCE5FB4|nr:LETM1-related biofilm-associated protein [Robertkochia marina]